MLNPKNIGKKIAQGALSELKQDKVWQKFICYAGHEFAFAFDQQTPKEYAALLNVISCPVCKSSNIKLKGVL